MIDFDKKANEKKYEEYVLNKHRIKISKQLMNEEEMGSLKKAVLYRSASTDPILRQSEYLNRDLLI